MSKPWRDSIESRHRTLRDAGLWRSRKLVSGAQGCTINVAGKNLVNFSSNDYLGLANHKQLKVSAANACNQFGVGSGASHLVCGHLEPHHDLEQQLASFVGAQRAILFSSGYMANLSVASTFLSKGDLLLQDKLNHASLIDGAKLSGVVAKRYAHCDVTHAETMINLTEFNRCIVASDSAFSMDGDIAPLNALKALTIKHQALLYIDDAHGFGVLGENGQGALEDAGLTPSGNTLMMGTLGKALGCYGAFIAGDELYIEHLIQSARPYIYTTALPPSVSASVLAALALLSKEGGSLRAKLNSNIDYFKQRASECDVMLMPSSTAIQPVLIGDPNQAMRISQALADDGFNVTAIRPPTVPQESARLRIALSSAHSQQQIAQLIESLAKHLGAYERD